MNLFENIVKKILFENRSNENAYAEFVNKDPKKGVFCYHCTPAGKGIIKTGARRQYTGSFAGNMYGDALYATYTLESAKNNWMTYARGADKAMIKFICHSDLTHFIFFDPIFCQQVHGKPLNLREQISFIFRNNKNLAQNILNHSEFSYVEGYFRNNSWTAEGARTMWRIIRIIEESNNINIRGIYIKGLVYSGHNDGNCIIPFDFASLEPIGISRDGGYTFEPIDTKSWLHTELLQNNADLQHILKYKYDYFRTEGFVNGYAIVGKGGKFKIINQHLFNKEIEKGGDGAISPIWFDEVYGQTFSANHELSVKYDNQVFILKAKKSNVYDVYDLNGHYLCDLKYLKDYLSSVPINTKQSNMVRQNISDDELDDF